MSEHAKTDQLGYEKPGTRLARVGSQSFKIHPPRRRFVEYQHLSAEELQSQIQQTKQKEAQLKQALNECWEAEKLELAQEIRAIITERGHDVEEIADQLAPRRRRGASIKKPRKFGSGRYTRYVDPDNPDHVYVRGVLPGWMKEKIAALGLDPDNKEDRDFFKANHMQVFPG